MHRMDTLARRALPLVTGLALAFGAMLTTPLRLLAQQEEHKAGGEANLKIPDLSTVDFFGINGHKLLTFGLIVCALGLLFGLIIYSRLKRLPVHASMLEISELIYETCKTYLLQQGKFLLILEIFIGAVILLYFKFLVGFDWNRVIVILLFSVIGIAGS